MQRVQKCGDVAGEGFGFRFSVFSFQQNSDAGSRLLSSVRTAPVEVLSWFASARQRGIEV
jgi:hypothetical protein